MKRFLAILITALCVRFSQADSIEFFYPASALTNGVCLWLEPVLGTSFETGAVARVVVTLPPSKGMWAVKAGAEWATNHISEPVADKSKSLTFKGSKGRIL